MSGTALDDYVVPNSDANFYPGFVPLADDWNRLFRGKVDANRGWLTNPTVVGNMTLGLSPTSDLHAASKAYVDAVVGGGGPGGGIPDAPSDGTPYCRLNHAWTPAPTLLTGNLVGDLHVSGGFYSATINTTGDITAGANLHVLGGTIDQGLGGSGTIVIGCNLGVSGTLTTTGAATIGGDLAVSGSISGAGLTALFSSPPPIGSVLPNTGTFTSLGVGVTPSGTYNLEVGSVTGSPYVAKFSANAVTPASLPGVPHAIWTIGRDGQATGITMESYGAGAFLYSRRANGTAAAPTAVPNAASMFSIGIQGHNGSAFTSGIFANPYSILADGAWTTASNAIYHTWATVAVGSTAFNERMRLTSAGALQIGLPGTSNLLTITPGAATTNPVTFTVSNTSGSGGFAFTTPNSSTNNTGGFTITTGNSTVGGVSQAGSITLTTGDSTSSVLNASLININAGTNTGGGPGGAISLTTGASTTTGNGSGGNVTVSLGAGFGTGKAGNFVIRNLSGTPNNLTITPGVAAANAIVLAHSGTGGFVFAASAGTAPKVQVGTGLVNNIILLASGLAGTDFATLQTFGSGGLKMDTTALGFNNATPITKPTVAGSRGGNAALAALMTALASYGLVLDSTTA